MRAEHLRWAVVLTLAAGGCAGESGPEVVIAPDPDASQDVVAADHDGSDGGDALDDAGETAPETGPDAAIAPVLVGLTPTAAMKEGASAAALEAEALLTVVSSGARALVLERTWEQLTDAAGSTVDDPWDRLRRLCVFAREQRRAVLLVVAVVEGALDRRPEELAAMAWSHAAARQSFHDVIDRMYATCGDELRYVSLGGEVDRYVSGNVALSPSFVQFALESTDYARGHPSRPAATRVGWMWTAGSWLATDGLRESDVMVAASDVVLLSYCPLDADLHVKAPSVVAGDLSALAARIAEHPIVLQRVSYPSSELIGGSEAAQALFIEGLFGSVAAQRSRYPFVGAGPLHDPDPNDCLVYAESQGRPGSAELFAAWCSVGLRRHDGSTKASFASFVEGASGMLEP